MFDTLFHAQQYRYGHAGFASHAYMARAHLFNPGNGVFVGYDAGRPVYAGGDAPVTTVAGSGAVKGRDVIVYNTCIHAGAMMVLDPKGELAAISYRAQSQLLKKSVWLINPRKLHGMMPTHRLNPLDILQRGESLATDAKMIAQNLIPIASGIKDTYWDLASQRWIEAMLVWLVHEHGHVTFLMLWETVNGIVDNDKLDGMVMRMTNHCPYPVAARTAEEIHSARCDESQKMFQSVYSTLINHLSWLDDTNLLDYLSTVDFSLKALTEEKCAVFVMIPAELLGGAWAGFVRSLFTAAFLWKLRAVGSQPVLFLVDEAAQLKRFQLLLDAYSYGRGMGLRVWSVWQSIEQMHRLYGSVGEFLASSQVRQFFGVRESGTAGMVSNMLGQMTLEYDDEAAQLRAKQAQLAALQSFWHGTANPFQSIPQAMICKAMSEMQSSQARPLMTPAEILNMNESEQIVFLSGENLLPLRLERHPYYSRQAKKLMYKRYDANPYHR